jgi:hypothetical protein
LPFSLALALSFVISPLIFCPFSLAPALVFSPFSLARVLFPLLLKLPIPASPIII